MTPREPLQARGLQLSLVLGPPSVRAPATQLSFEHSCSFSEGLNTYGLTYEIRTVRPVKAADEAEPICLPIMASSATASQGASSVFNALDLDFLDDEAAAAHTTPPGQQQVRDATHIAAAPAARRGEFVLPFLKESTLRWPHPARARPRDQARAWACSLPRANPPSAPLPPSVQLVGKDVWESLLSEDASLTDLGRNSAGDDTGLGGYKRPRAASGYTELSSQGDDRTCAGPYLSPA